MFRQPDTSERKTTSHFYLTKDCLGTGSSCNVYIGIQKSTGDLHALKVFKDPTWCRSEERQREVAALRRLHHPNIVRYFGEEEEAGTGLTLLVLELCQEGSLLTYLQEPANHRGLCDREFLVLTDHISSALLYLHEERYVHRDVKPGNILRHIEIDGSCVYKLSDFGASRILEEEDKFFSLAGTEEYLHPNVYEKAFVDRKAMTPFNSSVDLWSVGCTLYQAACNKTPFRPYEGARNNRGVMYLMTKQKPHGFISGYQKKADGRIVWERHLPSTCALSQQIKAKTTSLLQDLLVNDISKQISHETFYAICQSFQLLTPVSVFNAVDCDMCTMYIKPDCSLAEFQDDLAGKTDVMATDQLLFHKGTNLRDLTAEGAAVNSLATDNQEAIIFISKSDSESDRRSLPKLDCPPSFLPESTIEKDCTVANKFAVYFTEIKEHTKTSIQVQQNLDRTTICMGAYLTKRCTYIERGVSELSTKNRDLRARLEVHHDIESNRMKLSNGFHSTINTKCKKARAEIAKQQERLHSIKTVVPNLKMKIKSLNNGGPSETCSQKCLDKIDTMYTVVRKCWKEMLERKKRLPLSEMEYLQHKSDRKRVDCVCAGGISLYIDHCFRNWKSHMTSFEEKNRVFLDMEKTLNGILVTLTGLKEEISNVENSLLQINAFSGRAWSEITTYVARACKGLPEEDDSPGASLNVIKQSNQQLASLSQLMETMPELTPLPDLQNDKFEKG